MLHNDFGTIASNTEENRLYLTVDEPKLSSTALSGLDNVADRFLDTGTVSTVGGLPKRVFDIVFASVSIAAFAVLIAFIATALKLSGNGGSVFFSHDRVGLGGKKFRCLKFRTMVVDAQARLDELLASDPEAAVEFAATHKLRNDPRIVPGIGDFLRKTSLDELPQLLNVLKGEMSIVGPRPVTTEEIQKHYGVGHPYMRTRPGLTGLWQVSGRNDLGYAERVKLDAEYVENWRFLKDIEIILRTVFVVCLHRNGH